MSPQRLRTAGKFVCKVFCARKTIGIGRGESAKRNPTVGLIPEPFLTLLAPVHCRDSIQWDVRNKQDSA